MVTLTHKILFSKKYFEKDESEREIANKVSLNLQIIVSKTFTHQQEQCKSVIFLNVLVFIAYLHVHVTSNL